MKSNINIEREHIMVRIDKPNRKLLKEYSKLSIAFEIKSELHIRGSGLGGLSFEEIPVETYKKDYDTKDNNPGLLMDQFDLSHWSIISYFEDGLRVGGAILAYNTKEINMLEGKTDLAVLWDIRIDKVHRGKGIGRKLIEAAKEVATQLGCNRIKIETQNNNVKACRFYEKQGAVLTGFNKHCYKDYAKEVQMIWSIYL